jgi:hypothetical protein
LPRRGDRVPGADETQDAAGEEAAQHKWADRTLGEYVGWKPERRAEREDGRATRLIEARDRVRRRLARRGSD